MTKIVINDCHGGFRLTKDAERELYARGSSIIKAEEPKEYYGGRDGWEEQFKSDLELDAGWGPTLAPDGLILMTENYEDKFRADPILIALIEEWGDRASSKWTKLLIVEISDDVEWEIDEYDGWGHIAEKHRRWP